MTARQSIDYEALAREAMRGVVRAVLTKVASSGLPGEHHFYIVFNTQGQGVALSKRLKEKYPKEMLIVLQHRFWDLEVNDERFEVKLTFDGIPERVVVPFRCIKVFYDPSVPYGLQFEESELMSDDIRPMRPRDAESAGDTGPAARSEKRPVRAAPRKPRTAEAKSTSADASAGPPEGKALGPAKPAAAVSSAEGAAEPAAAPAAKSTEAPKMDQDAKVVDFSKFRNTKK